MLDVELDITMIFAPQTNVVSDLTACRVFKGLCRYLVCHATNKQEKRKPRQKKLGAEKPFYMLVFIFGVYCGHSLSPKNFSVFEIGTGPRPGPEDRQKSVLGPGPGPKDREKVGWDRDRDRKTGKSRSWDRDRKTGKSRSWDRDRKTGKSRS